ncbi:DUF2443 family protein [Helicobacter sp. MIT 14-3879]|uniref:DUF2443 family protein n=1 Tax=Helicobacter sp. MIT 14-3879 TaxID=2040649 RepID=UPI000E1EBAB0|nr:DUF2443 family protein [Helicobacter sp. MIT 14-3879]RDU65061.1 DUF2443 domain-containing protein [Helicobacter sp. MIT 14-3879]
MFDKINAIIKDIEDCEEEIRILLSMHKISFLDYVMIKRGSMDYPEHIEIWKLEQIDSYVNKLKAKIDELVKVKKEYLVF